MERYEKFFGSNHKKAYSFWHKIIDRGTVHVNFIVGIMKKLGKKNIRMLDIGCGEGDEPLEAFSHFPDTKVEIIANDISEDALKKYEKSHKDRVKKTFNCRLEQLPQQISDEKFDFILMSHCLYGADITGLFPKFTNLLADGGYMLIFQESGESDISKIRRKFWRKFYDHDFNEVTAEKIIAELNKEDIRHNFDLEPFYVYFTRLEELDKNGFRNLYLPFLFRTRDIAEKDFLDIKNFTDTLLEDHKLKNKAGVITICKKQQ